VGLAKFLILTSGLLFWLGWINLVTTGHPSSESQGLRFSFNDLELSAKGYSDSSLKSMGEAIFFTFGESKPLLL